MAKLSETDRFWSKVTKTDYCWIWDSVKLPKGYGKFTSKEGKMVLAHRFSLSLKIGRPLKSNELACHKCDNPSCVNPNHLFIGTHTDNMKDRSEKGRNILFSGENNGLSKLTCEDVSHIRNSVSSADELATELGVDRSTVYRVKRKETWKHIGG